MPLFQCRECGCAENTALGAYWWRFHQEQMPPICSECATGEWHGEFPKQDAVAEGYMIGMDGFLYGPEEKPSHTTILGPVQPLPTEAPQ